MSTTKWITITIELCGVIGGTWLLICVASISWEFLVVEEFGSSTCLPGRDIHWSMGSVYQTESRGRSHGIRSRYGSGVIRTILYSIERIISRL